MTVLVNLDHVEYNQKPEKKDIAFINSRIVKCREEIRLEDLAVCVGNCGCTFTPAVFHEEKRTIETFEQTSLFALDFDGGIGFEDIKRRADRFNLPIAFAYHTFSSTVTQERFRVVWLHEVSVKNTSAAKIIINLLLKIFPEADKQCADIARMFFGGNELLWLDTSASIDIATLSEAYYKYEFLKNKNNCIRSVDLFAKKHNVATEDGYLQIFRVYSNDRIEGDSSCNSGIYILNEDFPSFFISQPYHRNIREKAVQKSKNALLRIKDFDNLTACCELYKDFVEGRRITNHDERFLLLTNLLHIESGRKNFFHYLGQHTDNIEEWEYQADYIKKRSYTPKSCGAECPYVDTCNHRCNICQTLLAKKGNTVIQKQEDTNYCSIDEVYTKVTEDVVDAVNSNQAGLYLITAQTAVGKTSAYCNIVEEDTSRRYLIAVPTNMLKRQVYSKLKFYADVYATPSYDEIGLPKYITDLIQYEYSRGYMGAASRIIRQFKKENEHSEDPYIQAALVACERFEGMRERLEEFPRVVVTTHARLLNMDESWLKNYTVIVDEDILLSLFQNIKSVSKTELKDELKDSSHSEELNRLMRTLIAAAPGEYGRLDSNTCVEYERKEIERFSELRGGSSYYIDEDGENVSVFVPRYLHKSCKYIILSATLQPDLYMMYFNGYRIKVYTPALCRYQGNLKQFTAHSLSRRDCKEKFDAVYVAAKEISGSDNVITFKGKTNEYEKKGVTMNDAGIYFGNTSGINKLEGKDLIIIGTPHNVEYVYKLIGVHLGVDSKDMIRRRVVNDRNYQFTFATYENPALQRIQMFYIRSELEQAVGRARLLRKNCTVYLFSNFPCDQAEIIQDEYLA